MNPADYDPRRSAFQPPQEDTMPTTRENEVRREKFRAKLTKIARKRDADAKRKGK